MDRRGRTASESGRFAQPHLRSGVVAASAACEFSPMSDCASSAKTVTALSRVGFRLELRYGSLSRERAKEKGGNWPKKGRTALSAATIPSDAFFFFDVSRLLSHVGPRSLPSLPLLSFVSLHFSTSPLLTGIRGHRQQQRLVAGPRRGERIDAPAPLPDADAFRK